MSETLEIISEGETTDSSSSDSSTDSDEEDAKEVEKVVVAAAPPPPKNKGKRKREEKPKKPEKPKVEGIKRNPRKKKKVEEKDEDLEDGEIDSDEIEGEKRSSYVKKGEVPTGTRLIGERIGVYWEDDDAWYTATVLAYDVSDKRYSLMYDDEDEVEVVPLSKNEYRLDSSKRPYVLSQLLSPPEIYAVDEPCLVLSKGHLYPSKIVEKKLLPGHEEEKEEPKSYKYLVNFKGWAKKDREWKGPNDIRKVPESVYSLWSTSVSTFVYDEKKHKRHTLTEDEHSEEDGDTDDEEEKKDKIKSKPINKKPQKAETGPKETGFHSNINNEESIHHLGDTNVVVKQKKITKTPVSKRQVNYPIERSQMKNVDATLFGTNKRDIMDDLYSSILSWNFFESVDASTLPTVPVLFSSSNEYIKIFTPLLLAEIKSLLQNSLAENNDCVKIVDYIVERKGGSNPFNFVTMETKYGLRDDYKGCLVLISSDSTCASSDTNWSENSNFNFKSKPPNVLGLAFASSSRSIKIKVHPESWQIFENSIDPMSKELFIWQLDSLTSSEREYMALVNCDNYSMINSILDTKPIKALSEEVANEKIWKRLQDFVPYLVSTFNMPQRQAIVDSATREGFTLVQGPPGTGKTKTLIGILNTLHLVKFSQYQDKLIERISGENKPPIKSGESDTVKVTGERSGETFLGRMLRSLEETNTLGKQANTSQPRRPRILVCAPSNAAIDEIILRIMNETSFRDCKNIEYKPHIVRLGRGSHKSVDAVSLESLTNKALNIHFRERYSLKQEKEALCNSIKLYIRQKIHLIQQIPPSDTFLREQEANLLCRAYDDFENARTELLLYSSDNNRKQIEVAILDSANIVFTTLSSSGLQVLEELKLDERMFDTVVIDESAQSIELSTLIPLRFGCKQCILVGDPQQLPATVFSKHAAEKKFKQSMFERLQIAGHPVNLLSVQYRMHPTIAAFPSYFFYGNALTNGENVASAEYEKPYHSLRCFGPFRFFNLRTSQETRSIRGMSFRNPAEARMILNIYKTLMHRFRGIIKPGSIGIITPYSAQREELSSVFMNDPVVGGDKFIQELVDINTVDSFQGREKEIIIFSCVRADVSKRGIGFLNDIRRMNVGLTRGKFGSFSFSLHKNCTPNRFRCIIMNIFEALSYLLLSF